MPVLTGILGHVYTLIGKCPEPEYSVTCAHASYLIHRLRGAGWGLWHQLEVKVHKTHSPFLLTLVFQC